ncbi:MAG: DUF1638 domain-containing protein [Chloroflexota bacterium]|jgi:hypothetical protein|nr:MAG: DUF1638 domain-containing protein [Chloroflexota bacterium]
MTDLPVVFLACKVFEGIVDNSNGVSTRFLEYGLHSVPKQLNQVVQENIYAIEQPSLVVLGYGLCGNGLDEIQAGIHTLVIPKADDCIAIFMGSRQRYLQQFHENPGTYYLSKGWFEVGSDPLSEHEKYVEKYGLETADWLMEQQYQHYRQLVFVAQSQDDLDQYRPRALEVAAYCERFGMVYDEYLGSDEFIKQISEALKSQQNLSPEFIVVPPGGKLQQEMFLEKSTK